MTSPGVNLLMNVCLHRRMLGTRRHLDCDLNSQEFRWTSSIPDESWIFGGGESEKKSLNIILESLRKSVKSYPADSHKRSWEIIRPAGINNVKWYWALPDETFKKYISELLDQLRLLLEEVDDTYYTREMGTIRELLIDLHPAKIDRKKYSLIETTEKNMTNLHTLKSFRPDQSGYAKKTIYSHSSSVTGRLTVRSGPNILTLKKESRKILSSRYSDGEIMHIDFVSLEPRIILAAAGQETPRDLYTHISNSVFGGEVSREMSKISTLSAIYGMSPYRFKRSTGRSDAARVLGEVRQYFGISSLGRRLKKQMADKGYITNLYGRRIFPDSDLSHLLVSYYAQSSGVDAALLGFSQIVQEIKKDDLSALPLFVIHDALIIDVKKSHVEDLVRIIGDGLSLEKLSGKFPMSIEKI